MSKFEKKFNSLEDVGEAMKKKFGVEKEEVESEEKEEEKKGKVHDLGVFGVYGEPEEKVEKLKSQEQVAEDLIKAALGNDVFERPDKGLEEPKPQDLGAATKKEEKHYYGSAIDGQITSMVAKLKYLENSSKIFDKKATPEQKKERQKLIETLKHGIEEAKLRKEEIKNKKLEQKEEKIKHGQEIQKEGVSDLTTAEARQKEIERIWQKEEVLDNKKVKEKPDLTTKKIPNLTTPEGRQEKLDLEKSRSGYVKSYTEYRQEFGGMKKKDLAEIEKTIEPARQFIKIGDSELLYYKKENFTVENFKKTISLKEEKQAFYDAEGRKRDFVDLLRNEGIEKERAEVIYEAELKKAEYDAAKVEVGKKMKEGGATDAEIFKKLILDEKEALNKIKVESWPPKEKGIFRKGMEWYMKRGTITRLLISTGLVTGVVAGVGGFGAAAVATFAGYRFVRGFGSVMIGKLAGMGVDKIMSRGIEAQKEAALEKLKTGFDLTKLKNTEKELEKIFEENAKAERRKMLIKAGVSVVAGAGTAIGMGMLEHAWAGGVKVAPDAIKPNTDISPKPTVPEASISETPPAVAAEIKPEVLTIGNRGPEGAIIDYFRKNPDVAVEKFGCPKELYGPSGEITDVDKFNEWAGGKAHRLWLEDAKEMFEGSKKSEIIDNLGKLGYSKDIEGYAQMMRRIGEGGVEINPETGKIELVDTEYLKARISADVDVLKEPQFGDANIPKEPQIGDIPQVETPKEPQFGDSGAIKLPQAAEATPLNFNKEMAPWIEKMIFNDKISIEKTSWLTEGFLKTHKVKDILDYNFAHKTGVELYTSVESEWESSQWKEKGEFQDKIEKYMKRVSLSKEKILSDFKAKAPEMKMYDFLITLKNLLK